MSFITVKVFTKALFNNYDVGRCPICCDGKYVGDTNEKGELTFSIEGGGVRFISASCGEVGSGGAKASPGETVKIEVRR
ncbi:MAG: hypothetical protein LBR53_05820 [Deltaproteobacteria bacterium]|nr:hypothetical protein [Deltaproteobacteria bacterium]